MLKRKLVKILYDVKTLRRRLELLEARIEKSLENVRGRDVRGDLVKSYANALRQLKYVTYVLGILEVKLENVVTLNAVTQDIVVAREALKELSRRIRSLPEISAILDEIGDSLSDIVSETLSVDRQALVIQREAARRILDEAEKIADLKQREVS
ncbi:MAG: hypothetical protein RMH84_06315 [Sulfolobales archaeon]|nr:hypothetical protein [Sulfolobales archaeon]MCX8208631.1 hypothetical protein [Sulfolobales archaeon]MDW8011185.1 hypothetical protein [Sulfolobales archaeon]MDW8083573.1 hypothetical protein [Sulfolobales archaeon]